jgi:hypothetical protein
MSAFLDTFGQLSIPRNARPVDPIEEIVVASSVATATCIVLDFIFLAVKRWQQAREGLSDDSSLGHVARFFLGIVVNLPICAGIAHLYRVMGNDIQDAFLIGAVLWLFVAIPLLMTSRYMEDEQKKFLSIRILGWLLKTSAAATSASYFITLR